MPEHNTPDLHDFDELFGALERDIAGVSSPRGAGLAVATARRRRRTTIGAIAAVAVLAAGGAAIAQAGGHNSTIGPSDQPLPPPTPLSTATLEDASSGWMSGWVTPSQQSGGGAVNLLNQLTCLADMDRTDTLNNAEGTGDAVFTIGSSAVDYVLGLHFPSNDTDTAQARVQSLVAGCNPTLTSERTYADGSSASFAQVHGSDGNRDFFIWTARHDDRLGLMIATGAPQPPDDAQVARMDDFLVGALQVKATVSNATASSSGGSASASASGTVSPDSFISSSAFASALGSWPNGWSATSSSKVDTSALPCGIDPTRDAQYGSGTSLGASGQQEFYGFANPALADQTAQSVAQQLSACASYDVRQVALADGTTVMVGSSTAQSGVVVWLLQKGARVGYLTIPGSGTPPPDSVSRAVAALIAKSLAAASPGVQSGPPPQAKSVGPGAATATGHARPRRAGH